MKRWFTIILNLVAFDVCWTVTMIGAGRSWWWVGPVVVAASAAGQFLLGANPRPMVAVILAGSAIGVASDLLAASLGVFTFRGSQIEFGIVFFALWVNFGTTLTPTLRFLWRRPLVAALLGGLGGPLAYWVGDRIGAITLADNRVTALAAVAVQYAVLMPLWMWTADRFVPATVLQRNETGATR